MSPERLRLSDRLIKKWFLHAMDVLNHHKDSLSDYDKELFTKLSDGYNMVGDSMSITRKQLNHIKVVAAELEAGSYE